jgi:hypothetical protein
MANETGVFHDILGGGFGIEGLVANFKDLKLKDFE